MRMTKHDNDDPNEEAASKPTATQIKARETFGVLLGRMDKDLGLLTVMAAISQDYQKVIETMTTCSDVMYFREMCRTMKKPIDERDFSIFEIEENLKKHGFKF